MADTPQVNQAKCVDFLDSHLAIHIDKALSGLSNEARIHFEKSMMLHQLDWHWKEYLVAMDHLKQGIHLRAYAQKDPIQEYKKDSFQLFQQLLVAIRYDVISKMAQFKIAEGSVSDSQPYMAPFGLSGGYSISQHGVSFSDETSDR